MATAYRYTGTEARDYPTLGFHVDPGDVMYLDGRAPDSMFVPVEPGSMETGEDVPQVGADWRADTHPSSLPYPEPTKPNKAASQADWVEYAKADGSFEDATGTPPEDATRRAIVEHYSFGANPASEPEAAPVTEQPAIPAPAAPVEDDTPKEV